MSNRLAHRRAARIDLPPVVIPPERSGGGGPQRIHIVIDVHVRAPAPPRRGFWAALTWTLLALLLLAAAAHAQPPDWYPAPPPAGEAVPPVWSSTTWSNGVTTYTNIYTGVQTCTTTRGGDDVVRTECGPPSP
jgi:hypothetical protein